MRKWEFEENYMKKGDFLLIFTLLFLLVGAFFYVQNSFVESNSKFISVQVNGKEIRKIKFGVGKNQYPIRTNFGLNILEVDEEGVRVIEASCPDKLDVKFGKISRVGQSIVCLPNRLVIEVKSDRNNEIDVIN